jgi:hypothetical protein
MKPKTRQTTAAVVVEGGIGGLLLLAGFALGIFALDWTVGFWLATVGAACVGHAVTFGFGLLHRPSFWSASRGRPPRGS